MGGACEVATAGQVSLDYAELAWQGLEELPTISLVTDTDLSRGTVAELVSIDRTRSTE